MQALKVLPFSIECSGVRREELVRRAGQEITVEGAHINWTMRRIMYRVDKAERTNTMSELCNLGYIVDGANGVGCVTHGDQLSTLGYLAAQVIHVQRAVFDVDIRDFDDCATLL